MNPFPDSRAGFTLNVRGLYRDLEVLINDRWLHSTEVRYRIETRKGRWHLTMVYVYVQNPFQFLCRRLDHYDTEDKAKLYAQLFRRGMQRDARGTLKSNALHVFDICLN
ncbi:MAG: hypothetical protein LCH91_18245 [Bacteroidetes bacterium]|nr:hypothetical protein [Bacteroidota bacterium]